MAFNLNVDLKGVFPVSNGGGPTAQGIAMSAQAINTLINGVNPDGTPGASVTNAPPAPQSPPITRTPFTLAGIMAKARANPLVTAALVAVVGYIAWKAVK